MSTQVKLFLGLIGLAILGSFGIEQNNKQVTAKAPATQQSEDPFSETEDRDPFAQDGDDEPDEDVFGDDEPAIQPEINQFAQANISDAGAQSEFEEFLERKTELDLIDPPLADAVDIIREQNNSLNIIIDEAALDLAGISADDAMANLSVSDITLRSALRLMLKNFDLTYIFRDECVVITTSEEAERQLITRVYPVGDLLKKDNQESVAQSVKMLIDVVISNVSSDSWEEVGGTGSVSYFHGQLVVSQTQEAHERFEEMLDQLRTSISTNGGLEIPLPQPSAGGGGVF